MKTTDHRSSTTRRRLRRCVVAAVAVAGVGVLGLSQATAQPATMKVSGTFKNVVTPTGPSCAAPGGLCIKGKFGGKISGPDEGVVNSVTPTAQPDVVLGDANVTIHTKHGDLQFAHELFVYNTAPNGKGEFSWLMEITGGTGRYATATGYLQGVGTSPPSTNISRGTYVGEIDLG